MGHHQGLSTEIGPHPGSENVSAKNVFSPFIALVTFPSSLMIFFPVAASRDDADGKPHLEKLEEGSFFHQIMYDPKFAFQLLKPVSPSL